MRKCWYETRIPNEMDISGFFGNSVVSRNVFLEAVLREDVLLKQTCERMRDVWKEYK